MITTATILGRADPRTGERILLLAPPGDIEAIAVDLRHRVGDRGQIRAIIAGEPYMQARLAPEVEVIDDRVDAPSSLGRSIGAFDLVLAWGSVPWLPRENEIFGRILAALRPGGRFVFDVPSRDYSEALETCEGVMYDWFLPDSADFEHALDDAGFREVEIECIRHDFQFDTLAELIDARTRPFPLEYENAIGVERQTALRNAFAHMFDRDHDLELTLNHIAGHAIR
ncbi:MAG: class I SAM-dependent methyltransferase [Planctomycetes bacterium]|nr:class I SAM-dependent methyltransferase [Planctomycetota bacterium]